MRLPECVFQRADPVGQFVYLLMECFGISQDEAAENVSDVSVFGGPALGMIAYRFPLPVVNDPIYLW